VSARRGLLLAVAALLSVSAVLAVAILLLGDFGATEGRILATTAVLGGFGVLAVPGTLPAGRGHARPLAVAVVAAAAIGAVTAVAGIWAPDPPGELWQAAVTTVVLLVAGGQCAVLLARRRASDTVLVRRLFVASCALAATLAAMFLFLIWVPADTAGVGFARLLGAAAVADALAVVLQPLLARAAAQVAGVRLRLTLAGGGTREVEARGSDLAVAVAGAIRDAEGRGERVTGVAVVERAAAPDVRAGPAAGS
jgi:hypothetical protein